LVDTIVVDVVVAFLFFGRITAIGCVWG
jgi:hypothetical protein